MFPRIALSGLISSLVLMGCNVREEPAPTDAGFSSYPSPDRVEGRLEVGPSSMAVQGFAYEGRFQEVDGECAESTLLYIEVDAFGGLLGVEGGVLEGVTTLAPSEPMDEQWLWYQDPGPGWTEDAPGHNMYGGVWRVTQTTDQLLISVTPERICPGRPFSGGCTPGVPVELSLSRVGPATEPCEHEGQGGWVARSGSDLPLCYGDVRGLCIDD